jgi:hypothetical protein
LSSDEPKVDTQLAREIVRYCVENPNAAGDLEDFVRWRLMDQRVRHQLAEARKAIDWLVARGLLSRSPAGATSIFALNPDRRREAEHFAAGGEAEPPSAHKPEKA